MRGSKAKPFWHTINIFVHEKLGYDAMEPNRLKIKAGYTC